MIIMTDWYLLWILFLVSDWPYPCIFTASQPVEAFGRKSVEVKHEQDSGQHNKPSIQTQPLQQPHLSNPKCSPVSLLMVSALPVLPLVTFPSLFLFAHFISYLFSLSPTLLRQIAFSVFTTNFSFFREVIEGTWNAATTYESLARSAPPTLISDLFLSHCLPLLTVWIICSISNSPHSY